jgi:transposase
VSKSYRPWSPLQPYLLPPSPTEWLPEGHLAYFILEIIEQLDLSAIECVLQTKDARGERPYPPQLLLSLLLYGYCVGVFSSRRIERATHEDVAFRVLSGDQHPHFTTINEFRLVHREAFVALFVQGLQLCQRAGLVKLGHVSVDGSKILANASKHKAMSYKRMQEEEARLRAEVDALMARADEVNRLEDEQYGAGRSYEELPEELKRRESRIAIIKAAKADLEREAAAARAAELRELAAGQQRKSADPSVAPDERKRAAKRARKSEMAARDLFGDDDEPPAGGTGGDLPKHRLPTEPDGKPKPKAQRNFTDPDSRIMVKGGAFVQAVNAQVVVDGAAQVIVAQAVSNQAPDVEHFIPMLQRVEAGLGALPERMSGDSGYYSTKNVAHSEARGVDAYLSLGRATHGGAELRFNATAHPGPERDRMLAKLQTPMGRAIYGRRKAIVEPVFGQIQSALGFRRFSLRGLAKVRCEWALVCLVHNLRKLFRARPAPLALAAAA